MSTKNFHYYQILTTFAAKSHQNMSIQFTDIIRLPYTCTKSQGPTPSCWAFSMMSFLETEEWLLKGASPTELSALFLTYHKMMDQFEICALNTGKPHKLPHGGLGHTAMNLMQQHGIVPLCDYNPTYPTNKAWKWKMRFANGFTLLAQYAPWLRALCRFGMHAAVHSIMDKAPKTIMREGKQTTPEEIRDTLGIDTSNYVEYTSFTHLPFHQDVMLDMPDNFEKAHYRNIPLDQLIELMKTTLRNGHTFVWDGGIRNGVAFAKSRGYAYVKKFFGEITEERRSKEFLEGRTTDDHMLHIVGMAQDEKGRLAFIAKDSAPNRGPYDGIIYLYEDFVRLKTISIIIRKY